MYSLPEVSQNFEPHPRLNTNLASSERALPPRAPPGKRYSAASICSASSAVKRCLLSSSRGVVAVVSIVDAVWVCPMFAPFVAWTKVGNLISVYNIALKVVKDIGKNSRQKTSKAVFVYNIDFNEYFFPMTIIQVSIGL